MISVIIPAHNEAEGLSDAIHAVSSMVQSCAESWEIILVDDGSTDSTYAVATDLSGQDNHVKAVRFSRNFGKEAAILAGLRMSAGDAVITMDADLQHPPRLIPLMIEKWRSGAQVVDAIKRSRSKDTALVRFRARLFNTLLRSLSGVDVRNSSDYKLLDRVVVNTIINKLPERRRFYRGLVDWVGYDHETIPFDIESRVRGEGKWSIRALIELATTAIVSFTSTPLRIVTALGLITLIFALVVAGDALWSWIQGEAVSGYATIIITSLLIGSFTMISLGIIGEYLANVYEEIKGRPTFLISGTVGFCEKYNRPIRSEGNFCSSCGRPFDQTGERPATPGDPDRSDL